MIVDDGLDNEFNNGTRRLTKGTKDDGMMRTTMGNNKGQ
jgi:hypothetical protein